MDLSCWHVLVLCVQNLMGPTTLKTMDPPLPQVAPLNGLHTAPLTLSRLPSASLPTLDSWTHPSFTHHTPRPLGLASIDTLLLLQLTVCSALSPFLVR